NAVGTLRKMTPEADLFVLGQLAVQIVQTELDELVTADHGVRPVIPRSRFPSFRWRPRASVSQNHTATWGTVGNSHVCRTEDRPMLVGDSPAAPQSPGPVRKDELRPDEGRPLRDRRSRQDFRAALQSPPAPERAAGLEAEGTT